MAATGPWSLVLWLLQVLLQDSIFLRMKPIWLGHEWLCNFALIGSSSLVVLHHEQAVTFYHVDQYPASAGLHVILSRVVVRRAKLTLLDLVV